jgi:catechol 2,3-dioxygenase-like lactoylglutathione lyase family enzyme
MYYSKKAKMRFYGICLVTRDVLRLRSFYEAILQVQAQGDDTFTMLLTSGAALSIFTEEGMERMAPGSMKDSGGGRYTLEFEVEDVDKEFERLKALNIILVKPPTTQSWGRRSVWFRDPDGNIVNFFASVDS